MTAASTHPPAEADIRAQLERILASAHFAAADRSKRFLQYLVDATLAGQTDRLKEYTLALEVFDRDRKFDPGTNPAVRVEASRLRRRLEHYYLTAGKNDACRIELPRGSYGLAFSWQDDTPIAAQAATEDSSGPGGPIVAIVPFENLGDPPGSLFADGITVEIITALARFRELRVLGRHTVFRHRGAHDPVQLHAHLGARYVLEGSVRRSADRLRVNAQLLRGQDGAVLWSERYERDCTATSIFAIQDEIANHVVATVAQPRGVISRPELAVAKRKPPESLDAYDCILLFFEYAAHHSPERHRALRDMLVRELERTPGDAALWAALSMLHTDTWRFGFNPESEREDARVAGLEAAERAVFTDPLNPLSYHALFLAEFARGNLKAFREAGDRALLLNPNNTDILADFGVHLCLCADWSRGLELLRRALALDPEPPDWYWFPFFLQHHDRGEHAAALDVALRAAGEDFFLTHGMHALAYDALGLQDEARASVQRMLEANPAFPEQAEAELGRWFDPPRVAKAIAAFRRAGMPATTAS